MSDVVVKNVVEELNLEVIYGNSYLDKKVSKMMSSRPSVEIYSDILIILKVIVYRLLVPKS